MDNLASPHTPLSIERMVSPKGKGGIQPLQKYGGWEVVSLGCGREGDGLREYRKSRLLLPLVMICY